jgi:hypothetical protein
MPEEKNNSTTFLVVVLIIVILITIGLAGVYFFGGPKGTPAFLKNRVKVTTPPSGHSNVTPVEKNVYEGFIQELSQKERTIEGITYTYVIGLVDRNDNSVPVWLTDDEYNNLKVYDNRHASPVEANLSDIKGGQYLKVTRLIPIGTTEDQREVIVEIN